MERPNHWLSAATACLVLICGIAASKADARVFDTVIVDPGHGGWDRGGLRNIKLPEKAMALDVALMLREALEDAGLRVIMTRETDVYIPLSDRVAIGNRHSNAIFVSVHFNADYRGRGYGIETYSYYRSSKSPALRRSIHRQLISRTGSRNRGERTAGFYVLRHTKIPAVLVECGFISNARESKKIADKDYRRLLAECIADGILDHRDALAGRKLPRGSKKSEAERPAATDSDASKDEPAATTGSDKSPEPVATSTPKAPF